MRRLLALATLCFTACVTDAPATADRPPPSPPAASPSFSLRASDIELSLLPPLAVSTTHEPGGELLDASFDVADLGDVKRFRLDDDDDADGR